MRKCIEDLRAGNLAETSLQGVLAALDEGSSRRQSLLYLQAQKTNLDSPVIGMSLVRQGEIDEGPTDPDEWPYKTVLDALNDGWGIIEFPDLALLMNESRAYGLGCEFILEKWE